MRNLYAFMESQYGMEFDTPGGDKPLGDPEVDEVFRVVARELISLGLVTLR